MSLEKKLYKRERKQISSFLYDWYNQCMLFPFSGEDAFPQKMTEMAPCSPNDTILDMCCGTGNSTFAIRKNVGINAKIIGVDLSRGRIKRANIKNTWTNLFFLKADAAHTCFKNNYFDTVFIPHALHEMHREMRKKVVQEAHRILKENGRIIIFEEDLSDKRKSRVMQNIWFGYWLPYPINIEHITFHDMIRYGLINDVETIGFTNVKKISMFQGMMQIITGKK